MENIDHIYKLMPPSGKVRFWQFPMEFLRSASDPKIASELMLFFLKIVPLTIGAIAAIVAIFSFPSISLAFSQVEKFYKYSPTMFFSILTFLLTILAYKFISIYLTNRFNKKLLQLDYHQDFSIVQHVVVADILSDLEAVYAFRYIVRCKKDGISAFPFLYNWSGHGKSEICLRNSRWNIKDENKTAGNLLKKSIVFDRTFNKGDEIEIEYNIHVMSDGNPKPNPHLGISVYCRKYPIWNSHMIVRFQTSCQPISVYRDYYYLNYSLGTVRNSAVSLDADLVHRWPVRPKLSWCYCIRWDFGR